MKSISLAVFVIILFGAIFAGAQSGRKVDVQQAPPTTAAEVVSAAPEFSESTPVPKRPRAFTPEARQEAVSKSLKQKTSPAPTASAPVASPSLTPADTDEVVKVDSNLITVPVSVYDRNGLYIPNLQQKDFKIFEDGVEQPIKYFGSSDKPFTVVLLLDTSLSTAYRIEEIQDAAIAFVNLLEPQDQVAVVEFDGNTHTLCEATNDRTRLNKAIRKADFGYGTSLYDSVDYSLKKKLAQTTGRKAIVLFTDGVDTTSHKSSYDSTLDRAEESEVLVFPIYYNTYEENRRGIVAGGSTEDDVIVPASTAAEYAVGKKYLDELAAYTGGRVFRPEASPGGLTAAFEGIAEELRRQYNIGYSPDEIGKPGQRKTIKVRVDRPNIVVRARDGYIVGIQSKITVK
ncbi:MAG: VWA domain-containing protein [Pyrinomonadaceae bacterium]